MRIVVALCALLLSTPVLAQGVDGRPNQTDIWRAIKQGENGAVTNPASQPWLIKPPGVGCTEAAVGFTTPVHAAMPPIVSDTTAGHGFNQDTAMVLAAVFGLAFGVGAMLARNLGRPAAEG